MPSVRKQGKATAKKPKKTGLQAKSGKGFEKRAATWAAKRAAQKIELTDWASKEKAIDPRRLGYNYLYHHNRPRLSQILTLFSVVPKEADWNNRAIYDRFLEAIGLTYEMAGIRPPRKGREQGTQAGKQGAKKARQARETKTDAAKVIKAIRDMEAGIHAEVRFGKAECKVAAMARMDRAMTVKELTEIKGIPFANTRAMRGALDELKKEGKVREYILGPRLTAWYRPGQENSLGRLERLLNVHEGRRKGRQVA